MTRRRPRIAAVVMLGAATVLTVTTLAAPASAEVIEGPCTGSVTFTGPFTVTEAQPLNVTVIVPTEDTVQYVGNVNISPPDSPVPFAGAIDVALPVPFRGWTVVSWNGETEEVSDSGSYAYVVPSWVPRGTGGLRVTATHTQQGTTCIVAVTMALDGDPGAAAIIGVAGTFVFAAGTLGAGIKKKVK